VKIVKIIQKSHGHIFYITSISHHLILSVFELYLYLIIFDIFKYAFCKSNIFTITYSYSYSYSKQISGTDIYSKIVMHYDVDYPYWFAHLPCSTSNLMHSLISNRRLVLFHTIKYVYMFH